MAKRYKLGFWFKGRYYCIPSEVPGCYPPRAFFFKAQDPDTDAQFSDATEALNAIIDGLARQNQDSDRELRVVLAENPETEEPGLVLAWVYSDDDIIPPPVDFG